MPWAAPFDIYLAGAATYEADMLRHEQSPLFVEDPCISFVERSARDSRPRAKRAKLCAACRSGRRLADLLELPIEVSQLRHNLVDDRRTNRQPANGGSHRVMHAVNVLSVRRTRGGGRTMVPDAVLTRLDLPGEPAHPRQGSHDWCERLRFRPISCSCLAVRSFRRPIRER
jgi:hypothetical protein